MLVKMGKALRLMALTALITIFTVAIQPALQAAAATGTIELEINNGAVGTVVGITGHGFTPSDNYTVKFDSSAVGTGIMGSSGELSADLIVPTYPRGQYAITVTTSSDTSNTGYFTITPDITLDIMSGSPGSQFRVSGSGFKASSSVSILLDSTSTGTVTTSTSGTFSSIAVTVPYSTAGAHTITARDAIGPSGGVTFDILEPKISLSLDSGRVDDQISVSGTGFKPASSVSILFDAVSTGNVVTNAIGAFSNAIISIPTASGGRHIVTAKDAINTSPGVPFEVTQSMTISPLSGEVGDTVKISGSGFSKKSTATVEFDTVTIKINTVADASGTFTGSFEVPEAIAGKHTIHILDNDGNEETVTFTVIPELTISPENGPPGTMMKASGTGFTANKRVAIKYNGATVVLSPSISTNSRGSFFVTFEVPASLPGMYSVEASDSNYSVSAKFTAILSATISQLTSKAAPGHIGMQLSISGVGFEPNAKITVTRATIQEPLAIVETNAQGMFSINFTIPPSPSGEHHIIVTDGVNTKEFEFFIEEESPLSPSLLQPDTGKAKQPVFFDWKDVADPSGVTYTLQIARDERFDSVFFEKENLIDSELAMTEGELEPVTSDNPYYWRVKAVDGAYNESEWSEVRAFSTGFVLTLPNGETELILSAWWVYGIFALIVLIVFLSFVIGRKSAPF